MDEALQLLNMNRVARDQAPSDAIQFAIAVLFIAQVLAPFRGCILTSKHGRGFQIRSGFNQMVEDLNSVFRIPANRKIVNEKDLNPGIVFQLLPVFVQIIAAAQDKQFIQQVAVIYKHAAVVSVAGFIAKRGHEVRLARLRNAVNANIQAFFGKAKRTQLLHHGIVVPSLAAGNQVLNERTLVNELAEAQIGHVAVVHRLNVLRLQHFAEKLVRREIGQFRGIHNLLPA